MTVAETFVIMQESFNPSLAGDLNKTIQWNITGEEGGIYSVKIHNRTCEIVNTATEKPDLTVTISDKDWLALADEKLDAMKALITGKIKMSGDIKLALRYQSLFSKK